MASPSIGHGIIPGTTNPLTGASFDFSASGDNTIIAGTSNQTIRIFRIFFVCNAATGIKFKDGSGTDLTGVMSMSYNGEFVLDFSSVDWFITSSGNGFIINSSSAVQVGGRVEYQKS